MPVYKQSLPNILINLLALGQTGLAIAIIVVVRENLWWLVSRPSGWYEECLMAKPDVGINLCSYCYWTVGISFFLSIALMFSQCFIAERRSYIMATVGMTLLGSIWWLAFAITATVYGVEANEANEIQESYRNAAWIMAWVNFGLFLGSLVVGALVALGYVKGGVLPQQSPGMAYPMGPVDYQPGPYQQPPYVATGYPQYPPPAPQGYPQGYSQTYLPPPPPTSCQQQQQQQFSTSI